MADETPEKQRQQSLPLWEEMFEDPGEQGDRAAAPTPSQPDDRAAAGKPPPAAAPKLPEEPPPEPDVPPAENETHEGEPAAAAEFDVANEMLAAADEDDSDTITLGQILLEARGASRRTLTQVSQKTRIPEKYLRAFEADDYGNLPVLVYSLGYLRTLCREYDLNADPLASALRERLSEAPLRDLPLEKFTLSSSSDEDAGTLQYQPAGAPALNRKPRDFNPTAVLIAAVAVLLMLAVVTALVLQRIHWREQQDPSNGPGAEPALVSPIDWDDYIGPEELPVRVLPIPE